MISSIESWYVVQLLAKADKNHMFSLGNKSGLAKSISLLILYHFYSCRTLNSECNFFTLPNQFFEFCT